MLLNELFGWNFEVFSIFTATAKDSHILFKSEIWRKIKSNCYFMSDCFMNGRLVTLFAVVGERVFYIIIASGIGDLSQLSHIAIFHINNF